MYAPLELKSKFFKHFTTILRSAIRSAFSAGMTAGWRQYLAAKLWTNSNFWNCSSQSAANWNIKQEILELKINIIKNENFFNYYTYALICIWPTTSRPHKKYTPVPVCLSLSAKACVRITQRKTIQSWNDGKIELDWWRVEKEFGDHLNSVGLQGKWSLNPWLLI